jgi:hypothetical protein
VAGHCLGRAGPQPVPGTSVGVVDPGRSVDLLAWVTAHSRMSVLGNHVEAATRLGLDDSGSAEDIAGQLMRWLVTTHRP